MKKKIKVILIKDFRKEKASDIKEYSKGFVLNYLLPNNFVKFFNDRNLSILNRKKKEIEKEKLEKLNSMVNLKNKIEDISISFFPKRNKDGKLIGSVGFKDILQELEKLNLFIKKNQLMDFNSIDSLGEKNLKINLGNNKSANLKILVK